MLIGGLWRGVHLYSDMVCGNWNHKPSRQDEAIADSALAGFGTAGLWAIVKAVRNKDDHHPPD